MNRIKNLDYILEVLMREQDIRIDLPVTLFDKQQLMRSLMNTRPPWPASEEFIEAQDRELQLQLQEKGIVEIENSKNKIGVWQGDITRLKVDAIVNAANSRMLGCWHPLHNCIDNCIHSAAGIQLRTECAEAMSGAECPPMHPEYTMNGMTYREAFTSETLITKAYNLPSKYVIHTVGPIVQNNHPSTKQSKQLAACYQNSLALAEANGCKSIAFCCISTGVFGYPNRDAAEVAINTVKNYEFRDEKLNVIFNVFKDIDYDIYRQLLTTN